jgi:hypothetical protein
MRRWLVVVVWLGLAWACANPTSQSAQSASLAGTWSEQFSIPGPRLVLILDPSANGRGTYAIEAGRSGTVQVSGTIAASNVTLAITYDYGPVRTFRGSLGAANQLTGTFDDVPGTVVFIRT